MERLRQYALLMRLHRPIGIYLLLWPTLWALWIAGQGQPNLQTVLIFILGVVLMRSAGCVINDYADRRIDPKVRRTRDRPLATQTVSETEAIILFIVLCLLAFGLVLLTNPLTILLSIIAVLLAMSYPFMKRYTYWPQAHLGLAFSWAIPMAFAAQTGTIDTLAWWLLAINILWTIAYDTLYAMVDREDDLLIGVKSTAILFGRSDKIVIGILHAITLLLLVWLGWQISFGMIYYLGLLAASGLAIYQQWLIKNRDPAKCFQAFLNNHWLGACIFVGIAGDYWF
jgi:4-hydroxybenzoate polyprenyltransferase